MPDPIPQMLAFFLSWACGGGGGAMRGEGVGRAKMVM